MYSDLKAKLIFILISFSGLFFHVVGEGVVNLSKKAESVTDRESYIDFRLRLLGEQGILSIDGLTIYLCMIIIL